MAAPLKSRTGRRAGFSSARRPTFFTWLMTKGPMLAFAVKFLLCLGFFYVLSLSTMHERLLHAYRSGLAVAAAGLLHAVGEECRQSAETISSNSYSVAVTERCSAMGLLWCLSAAVLAFPAGWKEKAVGLLAGGTLLVAVNIMRVSSLFWTGVHARPAFAAAHETVWPALLIIATAAITAAWIEFVHRRTSDARA